MNEFDFEMLKVISDVGNITKASEKLCITQSALSKKIKTLEDELGVTLLERHRGGVSVTDEGQVVLNYGTDITKAIYEMRLRLRNHMYGFNGVINAGISIDQTREYIADLIGEYRNSFSNVQINIRTGKNYRVYDRFINEELDVAMIRGDFPWHEYKSLLSTEHVCLISSSGNDIKNETFISYSTDQYMSIMMDRWIAENGLKVNRNSISVDSITLAMELVERGYGWCLIPEVYLKSFNGYIQTCYFKDGTPLMRTAYIYAHGSALKKDHIRAFAELVQSYSHRKNSKFNEIV